MSDKTIEKITMPNAVIKHWKMIFNYSDTAVKSEYWYVILFDIILAIVGAVLTECGIAVMNSGSETVGNILFVAGIIFIVLLAASMVPLVSLTVRRLHDTGKSGWWMFLVLIIGIGAVIIMLMCANSSYSERDYYEEFRPETNYNNEVYGPPEFFNKDGEDGEDIVGPGSSITFEPGENLNECVYGPPSMFD